MADPMIDALRCTSGIHPHLNEAARKLLSDAGDRLEMLTDALLMARPYVYEAYRHANATETDIAVMEVVDEALADHRKMHEFPNLIRL